jgi:Protein kinase domain
MLPILVATMVIQSQPTFDAAFEDGLEAEQRGQWRAAIQDYARAISLRPRSANQVLIYGNNLLKNYFPYTRLSRCHAELGEWDAAEAWLKRAEAMGEPLGPRETLLHRVEEAKAKNKPEPQPPRPEPAAPELLSPPPSQVDPPRITPIDAKPIQAPAPEANKPKPEPGSEKTPQENSKPNPPQTDPRKEIPINPVPIAPIASSPLPLPRWLWPSLFGISALAIILLLRKRQRPRLLEQGQEGPSALPKRLGPYAVERLLGKGGFANTYLAHHEEKGTPVALKVLHSHHAEDPEFVARFRQEAQIGAQLSHPNLIRIIDPGPSEGLPWIAMTYVDGETLEHHLKVKGALPVSETLAITRDLAEALAYAHAQGVVHRDLKPSNVILSEGRALVMDLGIARIIDSATLTTTYAFMGTPLYAAPEAQLKTHVGPAADRYSIGMILFEMLAGQAPFHGETPFDILDQHRRKPLPDLSKFRKDLSPTLIRLVTRLGAKEPDERPEDGEILRLLRELQG